MRFRIVLHTSMSGAHLPKTPPNRTIEEFQQFLDTAILGPSWDGLAQFILDQDIAYEISSTVTILSDLYDESSAILDSPVIHEYYIEIADDRSAVEFRLRWNEILKQPLSIIMG